MGELLTIGEVARRAGVATSAIRYYERVGLLEPPGRVNGRRRYGPEVLVSLGVIDLAKTAGFTLDEIRELLNGFSEEVSPSERWRAMARHKLAELDALLVRVEGMQRLLREGLECECIRLADCGTFAGTLAARQDQERS